MSEKNTIQVGGQAVIEGVMMRSPDYVSVAVRKADGKIIVKRDKFRSWTTRNKFFNLPIIRGSIILIEAMVLGIKALNFSGEIAMTEEEKKKQSPKKKSEKTKSESTTKIWLAGTVVLALFLGFGLFFFVPLLLTELTGVKSGVLFNLVDGVIRLAVFLFYIILISFWKEIRRIFEYHGAEHKSIFAYESGKPLTLEDVKPYLTHHPRCGTSFLLIVMLVSLLVFIALGRPHEMSDRLIRFLFIPLIGGISYELIRLSGKTYGKKVANLLVVPGLWLQRITTKEPDDNQLEVALVALKSALDYELDSTIEIYVPS